MEVEIPRDMDSDIFSYEDDAQYQAQEKTPSVPAAIEADCPLGRESGIITGNHMQKTTVRGRGTKLLQSALQPDLHIMPLHNPIGEGHEIIPHLQENKARGTLWLRLC